MKDIQKIPRKALLEIYKAVCDGWKTKIANELAEQVSKDIEIDNKIIEEAYNAANVDQVKLLNKYFKRIKPKFIIDEINTLKDIYKLTKSKEEDIIIFNKPKNAFERYINACSIIPKIVEAYNEGEILDWTNNQYKYLPYFKKLTSGGWVYGHFFVWYSYSDGSASHHYKNSNNLIDGCNKFKNIYNDYYSYKG